MHGRVFGALLLNVLLIGCEAEKSRSLVRCRKVILSKWSQATQTCRLSRSRERRKSVQVVRGPNREVVRPLRSRS